MNRLLILLYILGVYSCSRSTVGLDGNGNPCSQSNSILYSGVFLDSFDLILDNDTSVINELRFDCTINSFLVAQTIYDEYGLWDRMVNLPNRSKAIVWDSLNFLNQEMEFTVMTFQSESYKMCNSSMVVLSSDGDMLSINSKYRDAIISNITSLVDSSFIAVDSSLFYRDYWMEVNPSRWKSIQNYKKKKKYQEENWWR